MEPYREGLNYVPLLAQNPTPPCSGRSRMSLNIKRSQQSLMYFNGNYEGDSSMLTDRGFELERLSLVDTESDGELQKDITARSSGIITNGYEKPSLAWKLVQFLIHNFIKPELREKMSAHIETFTESSLYSKILKWTKVISISLTYIFYLTTILCTYLSALCGLFWKRRVIFQNLVRRLLWRLTLAKCSDLSLFALILLSVPVLFVLSLLGFIISTCGYLKDALHYWGHIVKKI